MGSSHFTDRKSEAWQMLKKRDRLRDPACFGFQGHLSHWVGTGWNFLSLLNFERCPDQVVPGWEVSLEFHTHPHLVFLFPSKPGARRVWGKPYRLLWGQWGPYQF